LSVFRHEASLLKTLSSLPYKAILSAKYITMDWLIRFCCYNRLSK